MEHDITDNKHTRLCASHEGYPCNCDPEKIKKFLIEVMVNSQAGTFENGSEK